MNAKNFDSVWGVDFSGAKEAGRNIWLARVQPDDGKRGAARLTELHCLESLAGDTGRDVALAHLVKMIQASRDAVWAIDFPFAVPVEIMDDGCGWREQLDFVAAWNGDAYAYGRWCVERAKRIGGKMHIRRSTDVLTKTPFDCYHYRIVCQTFHGMRDVLRPLSDHAGTAVLPFDLAKAKKAKRIVVEGCPSSTLKRLGLPHQNYKQPTGGPLTARRRKTRRTILDGLKPLVWIDASHLRTIMRNPGGDALDAVIAAVGVAWAIGNVDPTAGPDHLRHLREGFIYA